jgi:hypothetical protein
MVKISLGDAENRLNKVLSMCVLSRKIKINMMNSILRIDALMTIRKPGAISFNNIRIYGFLFSYFKVY